MLQQTRVETVIPYFQRFIKKYPDVAHLARAKEDDLMKCWEGLGYYRRALQLKKGADFIMRERHGNFPQTVEDWMRIPGVGRYTAGAIASIALGLSAPIVDGNVQRAFARLFAVGRRVEDAEIQRGLWAAAEMLVPRSSQRCCHFRSTACGS